MIAPLFAFSSPAISRPTVVLPQPDSPTIPNVWPARIDRLTSATRAHVADLALEHRAPR